MKSHAGVKFCCLLLFGSASDAADRLGVQQEGQVTRLRLKFTCSGDVNTEPMLVLFRRRAAQSREIGEEEKWLEIIAPSLGTARLSIHRGPPKVD